ncbi:hypothetical protein BH10PLA2_BH10PLA2_38250 [soil metagenome]
MNRRSFLSAGALALLPRAEKKAQIAITLDLEMSRNFPAWTDTHWDFEKGNLNEPTKQYALEAGKRVRKHGGAIHYFAVGQVFEQPNVDWLKELVRAGHWIGNHTYDHVNVLATRPQDLQYRFQRAPWLIEGRQPLQVIEENVRLATAALKSRLGVAPAGFRTPGGFAEGLNDRPDVRRILRGQGFEWISSKYPGGPIPKPAQRPDGAFFQTLVKAQEAAQPYRYEDGLVEVPMSPLSDIVAFRTGRWQLAWFLEAIERALDWAIERRAVFDFLSHPSCLYVVDPRFEAIELICDRVHKARDKAEIVGLQAIASRVQKA